MLRRHRKKLSRALVPLLILNLVCAGCIPHQDIYYPPDSVPRELKKVPLPPYIIEPPDILLIESTKALPDQPIFGQHLVRPDGSVGLGIYGSVVVSGLTLDEARDVIQEHLKKRLKEKEFEVSVDVFAYNSKVYYVITDGGGYGEQVYSFPVMGSETVLDAISKINGLPAVASKKKIELIRRVPNEDCPEQELPVRWCDITQRGICTTNYQVLPGDRIYVQSDSLIWFDSALAKLFSPIQRVFGLVLLGSETIISVKQASRGSSGTTGSNNP
jgi:polysaccharide export outer membrane protein